MLGRRFGSTALVGAALWAVGCGGDYTYGPTLAAPGGVGVSISPLDPVTYPGAEVQFSAAVTGNTDAAVTWSVISPGGAPAPSGAPTITSTGLLTAGSALGTFSVIVRSVANDSIAASTTVTVSPH